MINASVNKFGGCGMMVSCKGCGNMCQGRVEVLCFTRDTPKRSLEVHGINTTVKPANYE